MSCVTRTFPNIRSFDDDSHDGGVLFLILKRKKKKQERRKEATQKELSQLEVGGVLQTRESEKRAVLRKGTHSQEWQDIPPRKGQSPCACACACVCLSKFQSESETQFARPLISYSRSSFTIDSVRPPFAQYLNSADEFDLRGANS